MILWRLALVFLPEIQQLAKWLGGALFSLLFLTAITVGIHTQAWAPWWFADRTAASGAWQFSGEFDPMLPTGTGRVTVGQRYALARTAGFSPEQAVIAAAVSVAENGSGDPLASNTNNNGTIDLGLWQINSIHWDRFGGRDAIADPLRNAQAAYAIFSASGWCPWFTYATSCGPNHRGTYAQFLDTVRNAVPGAESPEGPIRLEDDALFAAIQPWLGTPYLFGGTTRTGIDCSAFTQTVARQLGISLPRTAQQQYDATTRTSSPHVGDLVFFEKTYPTSERITHVGFYVGDGWMISASEPVVGRQRLDNPFWRARLVGYGRLRSQPGNQA